MAAAAPAGSEPLDHQQEEAGSESLEDDRRNRFSLSLATLCQALALIGEHNRLSRPISKDRLAEQMQTWLPKLDAAPHQWPDYSRLLSSSYKPRLQSQLASGCCRLTRWSL